jgi:hypothetical protein
VSLQAANVGKIKIEQLLSQMDTKRSPGAGYKRSDFQFDSFSYATEEYGDEAVMDDRQVAMYADILDAETIHADRALNFVLDQYERDAASIVFNSSSQTVAGSTFTISSTNAAVAWDTHASSTPIDDIINAREQVILNSGQVPNVLVVNSLMFYHLINSAQLVDRVKYTQTATQEEMAKIVGEALGIKEIVVAGGLTSASAPPTAAVISRVWSNSYAFLGRVAETEDPQEPCFARNFIWTGDGPGAAGTDEELAVVVEEYREEKVRGSVIRARNDRQIVVMYPQAGYLITNLHS